MSFYGKTYNHQKDERFKDFLDTLGITAERVESILNSRPSQKLEKNGDEYVLSTITGDKVKEVKFKSGVEFDETVTENVKAKTTFTVDGNVLKQVQKFGDGKSLLIDRQFADNELVVTLKSDFWDGSAHRHYTAA